MKRAWNLYLLAPVAVVAVIVAYSEVGPPSQRARSTTEIVTAEDGIVQSTVSGSGNVEAATDDTVNFQASGTLSRLYVKLGQHVTKGQLLATLDPTTEQLTLDQAEESLTAAEDELSSAEDGSSSSSTGTSSTTIATTSAASIASAEASVASAQTGVNSAESAVAETKLYAPTGGTIVSLESISPGDSVPSGSSSNGSADSSSSSDSSSSATSSASSSTTGSSSTSTSTGFAEIVNTGKMTMTVAFGESDISKVKVGQPATVSLSALSGVELAAHVTAISTTGTTSDSVVSYDATLTLEQSDAQVRPGMSATATVVVDQAQGVTVPNQALTASGSVGTVELRRSGKTVSQQVVVGLKGTSRTQIVTGLSAGAQLVVTTTVPATSSSATSSSSSSQSGSLSSALGGGSSAGGVLAGGGAGPPGGGAP